jgi:hypothetical protein
MLTRTGGCPAAALAKSGAHPDGPKSPAVTLDSSLNGNPFNPRIVIRAKAHHLGIAGQRIVNNAPIIRIHRLQLNRASGRPHGFGDLLYSLPKLIIPHRSPMADVHLNPRSVSILGLQNPVEKKL